MSKRGRLDEKWNTERIKATICSTYGTRKLYFLRDPDLPAVRTDAGKALAVKSVHTILYSTRGMRYLYNEVKDYTGIDYFLLIMQMLKFEYTKLNNQRAEIVKFFSTFPRLHMSTAQKRKLMRLTKKMYHIEIILKRAGIRIVGPPEIMKDMV